MNKHLLCWLATAFLLLLGCQPPATPSAGRPKVILSMAPYKTFIDFIGAGKIDTICLAPKGTDPHTYETPPDLVQQAMQAQIWFSLGEPGEMKFAKALTQHATHIRVIDLSQGLPLCPSTCSSEHRHVFDKHLWLSPRLAQLQAQVICEALCSLLPEETPLFRERLADFQNQLDALDRELRFYFATHHLQAVLTAHPSLGYFCNDYGIKQISVEIDGKEPLPRDIEQILRAVRTYRIDRVSLQPQHSSRGALRIAHQLSLLMKTIDPYEEDYFTNLRSIAHAIGD